MDTDNEIYNKSDEEEQAEILNIKFDDDDPIKQNLANDYDDHYEDDWPYDSGMFRDKEEESMDKDESPMENKRERKKSIYDLDSFSTSKPKSTEFSNLGEEMSQDTNEMDSSTLLSDDIAGLHRIALSPLTQKILGCIIGKNVTTEYPWMYVRKEIVEDNIILHEESSDFLPVKDEILSYPETNILIGYIPSSKDREEFYICVTESGKEAVMKHIEKLRLEQENRVRNAVYKTVGEWFELGSAQEVDDNIVKNSRQLLIIEVEIEADTLNSPANVTDGSMCDRKDAYFSLLPYRQTFENISRRLVDSSVQVFSGKDDGQVQTWISTSANALCQYFYQYSNAKSTSDLFTAGIKLVLELCDYTREQALLNSTWDLYNNDYVDLIHSSKYVRYPTQISYTEYQNYYDGGLCHGRVINDFCWHPLWTGLVIAAYTKESNNQNRVGPRNYNEVLQACTEENHALIWSFNDCLTPKLILECSCEVTTISTCPMDGNIIVGGCTNGQVVIWEIPGKIEQVEAIVVQTTAQVKYKVAMRSLMTWMKESVGSSVVMPAAKSSLQYSQQGAITKILWLPTYSKVGKNGRITALSADVGIEQLSGEFATSSEDGTIAFWNIKSKALEEINPAARKKYLLSRPEALFETMSSFKLLDGNFGPDYALQFHRQDETPNTVITTMTFHSPEIRKKQIKPFPIGNVDIGVRRYYQPILENSEYVMNANILVGTVTGEFLKISWEGYDFASNVAVNRETCEIMWRASVHDGPVTHSVRSIFLNDMVVTVGGKVFAVWREDFEQPVFWRRGSTKYTTCCWDKHRPSILILAKIDGSIEIWDFFLRSHLPSFTQSLSGQIITAMMNHELQLDPHCVGYCDYNGTFRVLLSQSPSETPKESEIQWMKDYISKEMEKIRNFQAWQKSKAILIKADKEREELLRIKAENAANSTVEDANVRKEGVFVAAKATTTLPKPPMTKKPEDFTKTARSRWISMELKRMQRIILQHRGFNEKELEKHRAPIAKLRQAVEAKKKKMRDILQMQDTIFHSALAALFPDQCKNENKLQTSKLFSLETKEKEEHTSQYSDYVTSAFADKLQVHFTCAEEEIIYQFLEIQAESLTLLYQKPFFSAFNWKKVLFDGKHRRNAMDTELNRLNENYEKSTDAEEALRDKKLSKRTISPLPAFKEEAQELIMTSENEEMDAVEEKKKSLSDLIYG